jgi:ABC-2 type transport system ATP-binding protein
VPTTMSAAASVRGLSKRYGQRTVVDDVSFEIARGECFALLGPNGAGKTTTLEMMQGIRARSAGDIEVLGEDPRSAGRQWRCRIGVVAQSIAEGLDLTVGEMIAHFARYHACPRPDADLLATVDLGGSADVRVPKLSGGQRRRLEVALAVQGRPELLFLDEPTTGLDPVARRGFWMLVDSLCAAGTTVLLTTHYLDEAERLADRVGVIAAGRLVAVAPPAQLGAELRLATRIRYRVEGRPGQVSTTEPVTVLRALLAMHEDIADLDVRRPSLEDVYLTLIGADLDAGRVADEH